MELTRSESIYCYNLITNERKIFLGRELGARFEAMRDEYMKNGHEIPYNAIPEHKKDDWIAYGKQQAASKGLTIEKES